MIIPDSNFFNFKDDIQSAPAETLDTGVKKDIFEEESKQIKTTSLDKNITLCKQKSFEEDPENLVEERHKTATTEVPIVQKEPLFKDKDPFLGEDDFKVRFNYLPCGFQEEGGW